MTGPTLPRKANVFFTHERTHLYTHGRRGHAQSLTERQLLDEELEKGGGKEMKKTKNEGEDENLAGGGQWPL